MGQCSKVKDNCLETGCCSVVGYTCFQTKANMGKCLKNCTPSANQWCTQPQFVMDPILQDAVPQATTLYCFSVYTKNTGLFTQVWKKITKHVYTDWTVKVDGDAVFIPNRLRSWLGGQLVPYNGIY